MWEKFKPLEISPEVINALNNIRHDNNAQLNEEAEWLANGRDNDEAFNHSEKAYLDELKKRISE